MSQTHEMRRPRLLICAGSTRADSLHRQLARAAEAALLAAGAEATFVEIGDYDLPLYNQDLEEKNGLPLAARQLRELLVTHDGLALASPEYNGSYSPLLKNTIDWVSRPLPGERHSSVFKGKTAGLLSTTPGPSGGRVGLTQLQELLAWIGMDVIQRQATIPYSSMAFDSEGRLQRPEDLLSIQLWAEELVHAAQTKISASKSGHVPQGGSIYEFANQS